MKFIVQWHRIPGVTPLQTRQKRREVEPLRPAGLKVLGEWYAVAEPEGVAIIEADDPRDVALQFLRYASYVKFSVTPALSREEWEEVLAKLPDSQT
ncbi:hypothetical protein LMG27952_03956 [Paraburkholderia hiiakae]|uniref:DUF3303 domain-containing protein n=1 Tax=Paraburkholderia hiiakae TaxID=1081782 RepID=A0ABM8NTK7_9BURK|nr:DUF3303 family protein [Paraburkholderia hiiakae]CAD6542915.1 hypothetical protein LMG27952_03956 [Paraburkholderia hiiakae]